MPAKGSSIVHPDSDSPSSALAPAGTQQVAPREAPLRGFSVEEPDTHYRAALPRDGSRGGVKRRKRDPLPPIFGNEWRDKEYLEDGAEIKHKCMLHPRRKPRIVWDSIVVVLLMYNVVVVPIRLATLEDPGIGVIVVETCMDFFFIADIVLNFRTAAQMSDGQIEWNAKAVARAYLTTWFFTDLIGSVPIDVFLVDTGVDIPGGLNKILRLPRVFKLLKLLKLIRLVRLARLVRYFGKIRSMIRINPGTVRMLRFLFFVIILVHFSTCLLIFVASKNGQDGTNVLLYEKTWMTETSLTTENGTQLIVDSTIWVQYLTGLYWVVTTMTTLGYGDITPETDVELVLLILLMSIGCTVFAYITGNIVHIVQSMDIRAAAFKRKMDNLDEFMHVIRLPYPLRGKIQSFMEYAFAQNSLAQSHDFLTELSPSIKTEVALFLHKDLITKVPFFRDKDPSFLTEIVMKLRQRQYGPGDSIYRAGDVARCMYFLSRGLVQILSADEKECIEVVEEGNYFGEMSVLSKKTAERRTLYTVQSVTWTVMFSLHKSDLDIVLEDFPDVKDQLLSMTEGWRERMAKLSKKMRMGGKLSKLGASGDLAKLTKAAIAAAAGGGGGRKPTLSPTKEEDETSGEEEGGKEGQATPSSVLSEPLPDTVPVSTKVGEALKVEVRNSKSGEVRIGGENGNPPPAEEKERKESISSDQSLLSPRLLLHPHLIPSEPVEARMSSASDEDFNTSLHHLVTITKELAEKVQQAEERSFEQIRKIQDDLSSTREDIRVMTNAVRSMRAGF